MVEWIKKYFDIEIGDYREYNQFSIGFNIIVHKHYCIYHFHLVIDIGFKYIQFSIGEHY